METISSCVAPGSQTKSRWKSGRTEVREWISASNSFSARGLVSSKMLKCLPPEEQSGRFSGAGQELAEVVVHARDAEVWLSLEWLPQVVHTVGAVVYELDDGKDEVFGLVQR